MKTNVKFNILIVLLLSVLALVIQAKAQHEMCNLNSNSNTPILLALYEEGLQTPPDSIITYNLKVDTMSFYTTDTIPSLIVTVKQGKHKLYLNYGYTIYNGNNRSFVNNKYNTFNKRFIWDVLEIKHDN